MIYDYPYNDVILASFISRAHTLPRTFGLWNQKGTIIILGAILMRKLINFDRVHTQILITVPLVLGLIFVAAFSYAYTHFSSSFISMTLLILAFFCWGLTGIPMIVRKEAPGYLLKGYSVVIQGWVMVIFGWSIVILLLVGSLLR